MEKILVSACLMGEKVRYDGLSTLCAHPLFQKWAEEKRLITICPEVSGGASIPRPPAEIVGEGGGAGVIDGKAFVKVADGTDMSGIYLTGAHIALEICQRLNIKYAILKENSPSCGSHFIYDGRFTRTKIAQQGVTAALLIQHGIRIFSEHELDEIDECLLQSTKSRI